jgi:hypothetical protein
MRAAALAVLCALPLAAQTKLTGKSFLPPDYTNVVSVDLAAMRTLGIWDDVEASVLKVAFKSMEKELGWPLRCSCCAALRHITPRRLRRLHRSPPSPRSRRSRIRARH